MRYALAIKRGFRIGMLLALFAGMFFVPMANASLTVSVNEQCLGCHGREGPVKHFANGESVEAYLNAEKFQRSVHGNMSCTDCHEDFSGKDHPKHMYRSRELFRIRTNRVCRDCHGEEELAQRTIHLGMLEKEKTGDAVICSGCHSAHAVTAIKGGRVVSSEESHCMTCHKKELRMQFIDGGERTVRVDMDAIHSSPHRELRCSDCHFGFSSKEHPQRKFRNERDYILAISQTCKRCHYDKYAKLRESIHYKVLQQKGGVNVPTCVECHGGHAISSVSRDRLSTVRKCRGCHEKVYEIYAGSVHGNALFNKHNRDVPICTDCHTAHQVKDPYTAEYHENIPDTCSSCHSNEAVMAKYGISTNVIKTYLSDFHGVTLSMLRDQESLSPRKVRSIAVCTDCHGTHDIMRVSRYSPELLKQKLLERCKTCHRGATENFPDAWLSHYEPSLKTAPAVFIVKASYQMLMPLMVAGLVLQIFLHIWRYLVNR